MRRFKTLTMCSVLLPLVLLASVIPANADTRYNSNSKSWCGVNLWVAIVSLTYSDAPNGQWVTRAGGSSDSSRVIWWCGGQGFSSATFHAWDDVGGSRSITLYTCCKWGPIDFGQSLHVNTIQHVNLHVNYCNWLWCANTDLSTQIGVAY